MSKVKELNVKIKRINLSNIYSKKYSKQKIRKEKRWIFNKIPFQKYYK